MDFEEITIREIFSAKALNPGQSVESQAVDLGAICRNGIFSIQYAITGDGILKIEYLLSLNRVVYITPSTAREIASGLTKASGPNEDGVDILSFEPELARWIKIRVTETTGTSGAGISLQMAVQ